MTARKDWQHITPGLRAIYTAPTAEAAAARFAERWGSKYPAVIRTWEASWNKFTPFLAFDPEIRTVVYTTSMIESLNARFRQAIRRRGHFPQRAGRAQGPLPRHPGQEEERRQHHRADQRLE